MILLILFLYFVVFAVGESHVYFVGEEAIADTDITQVTRFGNK